MGAVAIFVALTFARGFTENDEAGRIVLRFLSISLPILIGFMSTIGLISGIGLLAYKSWARYLLLVVSAIGCVNIPFGTLKGIYSMWVLLQDETIVLFTK
jgi:hypothetical protein